MLPILACRHVSPTNLHLGSGKSIDAWKFFRNHRQSPPRLRRPLPRPLHHRSLNMQVITVLVSPMRGSGRGQRRLAELDEWHPLEHVERPLTRFWRTCGAPSFTGGLQLLVSSGLLAPKTTPSLLPLFQRILCLAWEARVVDVVKCSAGSKFGRRLGHARRAVLAVSTTLVCEFGCQGSSSEHTMSRVSAMKLSANVSGSTLAH